TSALRAPPVVPVKSTNSLGNTNRLDERPVFVKVTKREVVPGFNYGKLVSQECFLSDGLRFEFLRQVSSAQLNKQTSYKLIGTGGERAEKRHPLT
ncbi:hypothetical protein IRJ41_018341, partial [Triplophysa rosa]